MKLEKLTPEQEQLMFQIRDEWIDLFFKTKRINKREFKKGIAWLYNDLLKKPTPKIIYCESWVGALIAIKIMKDKNFVGDAVMDSIKSSVRSYVWDSVSESVRNSVMTSVWFSVSDSVRDSVRDSVWASVSNPVLAYVWNSVKDSVKGFVEDYSNQTNSYGSFGYCAFYEYFEKIGVLKNDQLAKYKALIKSCAFQVYEYENYVFAIQPPKNIFRNDLGQLNSVTCKAFEWADGYGFYYINGVEISEDYFNKVSKKELTQEEFFKEENEDKKAAIIGMMQQLYGDEYVFRFFSESLTEVDSYVDKKEEKYLEGTTKGMNIGVYTLFKGVINDVDVAYVRCYCPSTDRMFFLGVHPENTNAKDAIASLYQVPKKLKDKIKYIQRQGERFSTVFDEEGTMMLKNGMLQSDISDTTTISGNEYFSKLKYEY